ncbi:hypothetical protein C8R41DRAFT_874204 [Lentinula lateritia]|uniref:PIN domain-like protein n=1 Tax=Lentinula lateritia TaxID=40482 RepID=A0ABQ8VWU5_9AGAR|nr:hypothetical protein C8R41DRAFT_874204 [Lentinula lateritia]
MGVKSLWTLLTPVGRPVMLENMEGKIVAIDSSIWIYQFQATMRAKDGRALVNAHVLGFLRRICKLLFYGMKPVFVFDGGAPVLKRETLNERRKKKTGAAASHVKLAERLLAAQLRREALKHVKKSSPTKGKGSADEGPIELNDGTVYLEDIDSAIPSTPHKKTSKAKEPTSSAKKNKFYDHDPYRLPDVNLEERVAVATRSSAPDPRLATEDELRLFIENMRPEDFDVTSPAFRELPTEVQYEIVGDLRLKSRQTSYTRLQQMLKSAPTPLDFSKQQIKNLKQRNSLTQQLLTTTDSIGKAHISIPVRIASERNREYMLIRNEGATGGWILGIRDEGTKQKPIIIDHEEKKTQGNDKGNIKVRQDSDEDDDMEEVSIPIEVEDDPDIRTFRRDSALSAISRRYLPKPLAPLNTKGKQKAAIIPLFDLDEDEENEVFSAEAQQQDYWEEDEELAFAIQESLEYSNVNTSMGASSSRTQVPLEMSQETGHQDTPRGTGSRSRLETALSIANASASRSSDHEPVRSSTSFGQPFLLRSTPISGSAVESKSRVPSITTSDIVSNVSAVLNQLPSPFHSQIVPAVPVTKKTSPSSLKTTSYSGNLLKPEVNSSLPKGLNQPTIVPPAASSIVELGLQPEKALSMPLREDGVDGAQASVVKENNHSYMIVPLLSSEDEDDMEEISMRNSLATRADASPPPDEPTITSTSELDSELNPGTHHTIFPLRSSPPEKPPSEHDRSRPPTPPLDEDWDAAHEMNPDAEEGDFAQFVSQVKGRNIDDVRREIDAEIASLDQQRKNAMRDAEDVNQQMVTQIMMMLRLFGIPYITAPMEAEAQCAELLSLNLVDAIITDDSDVFLFGGYRVFKNMFNQSKTVECFLLSDLSRELGLDQGTLIRLAYLLGSDYVEGLPGVGPVVAMELLKEFPGDDGLHKFKNWWLKVQSGKDHENDNSSSFQKRFKKKFKDLYLPVDWPNPAVRDAYYHPTVDTSDEPFKWGLPDLDALRAFLNSELSWGQAKVDDLLLPIVQKVGKRGQVNAINRQGNLNVFFDVSAGSGTAAPRKRQAYASKRLQQVVSDFRKKRKSAGTSTTAESSSDDDSQKSEEREDVQPPKKKQRTSKKVKEKSNSGNLATRSKKTTARRPRATKKSNISGEDEDGGAFVRGPEAGNAAAPSTPLAVNLRPRPKPKPNNRRGALSKHDDSILGKER